MRTDARGRCGPTMKPEEIVLVLRKDVRTARTMNPRHGGGGYERRLADACEALVDLMAKVADAPVKVGQLDCNRHQRLVTLDRGTWDALRAIAAGRKG